MRKIILGLLLYTLPISAAIFHEIDTTRPLYCNFSNKHHNRILVDQSRVKKIIFPEERLFVRMEEVSGQVFVQAKYPLQDLTVISVITQEGLVQDLEIMFSDCPSEIVVLKDCLDDDAQQNCDYMQINEVPSMDASIDSILKGKMPAGYLSMPFKRCLFKPKFGISAKLVGKLIGDTDTLCIYEITNTACLRRKIKEKEMSCLGGLWTFLEKNCLAPKEKILAIVAVQNE